MLLCLDIGNTNIKFGLFAGAELRGQWRISTDRSRLAPEYAMLLFDLIRFDGYQPEDITGCVISSVVPALTQEFDHFARHYLGLDPVILNPETRTGLAIHTDYPSQVGPDLIANAVAARHLYGTPAIVIGFGTATTFGVVSEAGDFEGVAIAPGVLTGAEALFRFASRLPQVELTRPPRATGKNTIHSMQSGLIFGFAGLVEGLVRRLRSEWGENTRVVATGGLADIIAAETGVIEAVEPNLTLVGLRLIFEFHQGSFSGTTFSSA